MISLYFAHKNASFTKNIRRAKEQIKIAQNISACDKTICKLYKRKQKVKY